MVQFLRLQRVIAAVFFHCLFYVPLAFCQPVSYTGLFVQLLKTSESVSFNLVWVIIDSICYSPVLLRNILQIKVYQSIHLFWNIVLFTNIVKHKLNSTFLLNTVNIISITGFPRWLSGKESSCQAGDAGSIPGSERFLAEGNGNPLQYSCLGNPMDRGDLLATVHGVTKCWTQFSD